MRAGAALSLLLVGVTACTAPASGPIRVAASPRASFDAGLADAAEQVRRCYRSPRIASAGRQIATRLRVRFGADGALAAMPAVVAQDGLTPANRVYAGPMAQAAIAAVLRCAPLQLPAALYSGESSEFELTFSPAAAA